MEKTFSPGIISAVNLAKALASEDMHSSYGVAHLSLAMLKEPTGLSEILKSMGKDVSYIQEWFEVRREAYVSDRRRGEDGVMPDKEVTLVLEESERSKIKLGTDYIDALCIFSAILRDGVIYNRKQIDTITVSEEDFLRLYSAPLKLNMLTDKDDAIESVEEIEYCENLLTNNNGDKGALIVGRDKAIRGILENLGNLEKSGILIVGDPGVGKTALIDALIYYILNTSIADYTDFKVIGLNISKLLASCSSGNESVKKLNNLFNKIYKIPQSILIIDDIHVLLESSQENSNIINLIASELNNSRLNLIATINADAYRKVIEKHSIKRKLEVIQLEELEAPLLRQCMENHRTKLSNYYKLKISNDAIEEAIHSSKRYFKENKLPYGSINVLNKTLAAAKLNNNNGVQEIMSLNKKFSAITKDDKIVLSDLKYLYRQATDKISPITLGKVKTLDIENVESINILKKDLGLFLKSLEKIIKTPLKEITAQEVTSVVSNITGIPIGKIQEQEKDKLLDIENKLEERVKGQNHAIKILSDAIVESRSGLSSAKQPIGSFFFLGPTGTGKTELTKALAELLFDDDSSMIRFDMSEFKEEHSAALLYGAPPGYVGYEEGGLLVNKIRQKPYSVILFDEIEKAHSSVYDVFLQIMDEGHIHDKLGREGDFSNAIIIFTSNIGSDWIQEQIEKEKIPTSDQLIEIMSPHFRPEFLGRLTEVVPFAPINEAVAELIFKVQLSNLQKQLAEQKNIMLTLGTNAISYLTTKGYSKNYGARPISGVIRNYIKKAISRMIVSQDLVEGDKVLLDFKDNSLVWEKIEG